ncbi:hypothetical protein Tco_0752858 [Tanacetum coccineum]
MSLRCVDSLQRLNPKSPASWPQPMVPNSNLFYHSDRYTQRDIDHAASEDLMELSAEEAWETIKDCSTNACDELIGSLGMMNNEVRNTSPQSTSQILPLFEEYTSPVTYPEEVEKTLGTPIEEEPLDHTKLEDVCFDTCNHDIPLSSREVPSFN